MCCRVSTAATGSGGRRRPRHFCRPIEGALQGDSFCPIPSHQPAVEAFSVPVCVCACVCMSQSGYWWNSYLLGSFPRVWGILVQSCLTHPHSLCGVRECECETQIKSASSLCVTENIRKIIQFSCPSVSLTTVRVRSHNPLHVML